jgi:hypothetical protein
MNMVAYIITLSWLYSFFLPRVFSRGVSFYLGRFLVSQHCTNNSNNKFLVWSFVFVVNSVVYQYICDFCDFRARPDPVPIGSCLDRRVGTPSKAVMTQRLLVTCLTRLEWARLDDPFGHLYW